MLKVKLHTHTSDDPLDRIPHTSHELIDRAAELGYDALAITLHERQLDIQPLISYARDRRLVLIAGVEQTVEGRHVLLLNFPHGSTDDIRTFDDLRRLRRQHAGLIVAPHPFFPSPSCLFGRLDDHADLFDAVEYNAMYTRSLEFNRAAERWAARRGKPMVGNGDVHRLCQLGTTYSIVDAQPDATSICQAVAAGRVRVVSRPLAWTTAAAIMASLLAAEAAELTLRARSCPRRPASAPR